MGSGEEGKIHIDILGWSAHNRKDAVEEIPHSYLYSSLLGWLNFWQSLDINVRIQPSLFNGILSILTNFQSILPIIG